MEADLKRFRAWLVGRGRDAETASGYCREVKLALEADAITDRILDRTLAPKTRHRIVASLRAWAKFKEDGGLLMALSDIRLPPAKRKTVKRPFERQEWLDIVEAVREARLDPPLKATCMIICLRGLRVGDALRMRRSEVRQALRNGRLVIEAKRGHMAEFTAKPMVEALEMLDALPGKWEQVEDLVSPGAEKSKRRAARKRVHLALRRVAKGLGIDPAEVYPHRFRRTYAVQFLKAMKGDPEAMQKLIAQMQWLNSATALQYTDYQNADDLDSIDEGLRRR